MKAVRFLGSGKVMIDTVPDPVPDENSVLIKVKASAICGSELHGLMGDREGADPSDYNGGHEVVGEIVQAPEGCEYPVGTRVGARVVQGCGDENCPACGVNDETGCKNKHFNASNGHSELFALDVRGIMPIPEGVSWPAAAILTGDGLGVPVRAAARLGDTAEENVVVLGQGPIGLGCTLVQSFIGANVMATDVSPYRLRLAKELGADAVVNVADEDLVERVMAWTDGLGADVVILAVANNDVLRSCFQIVRRHGTVFMVAELGEAGLVFNEAFLRPEAHMTGSWYYGRDDWPNMLKLHEEGLAYDQLITHSFPFEQAQAAYDTFRSGKSGKVILTY